VKTLDRLFAQYGLEIFHADMLTIHGGSLELLVASKARDRIDASVDKMRAEEKRLGFDKLETYQNSPPASGKSRRNSWPFFATTPPKEKGLCLRRARQRRGHCSIHSHHD